MIKADTLQAALDASRHIRLNDEMPSAAYGRVTDDRLTAASAVFSAAIGENWDTPPAASERNTKLPLTTGQHGFLWWS
jgi:hypothetical protein